MMGSGGMVVMDERSCMVDVAKYFMEFIRNESCGKCTPCREGTTRMHEILVALTERPVGEEMQKLERFRGLLHLEELAETIKETSLCGLGQTAANPVLSTLRFFRDEYEAHIMENAARPESARVCAPTAWIPAICTGCTRVVRGCPSNAIVGERRKVALHHRRPLRRAVAPAPTPAPSRPWPQSPEKVAMNITINEKRLSSTPGETVLQVARRAGSTSPTSAPWIGLRHRPLPAASVWWRWRESLRLQTSCTLPAAEGMVVRTHTPRLLKARRAIVELLVANHPQDCLTCSRSGSCELAELAGDLGVRQSRYVGSKKDQPIDISSPAIWRDPNKCVLCGRCVTMCQQVQGVRSHRLHGPRLPDSSGPGVLRRAERLGMRPLRPVRAGLPHRRLMERATWMRSWPSWVIPTRSWWRRSRRRYQRRWLKGRTSARMCADTRTARSGPQARRLRRGIRHRFRGRSHHHGRSHRVAPSGARRRRAPHVHELFAGLGASTWRRTAPTSYLTSPPASRRSRWPVR